VARPNWRGLNLRGRADGGRTTQSLRRPEPGEAERVALACTARVARAGLCEADGRTGVNGTARRGGESVMHENEHC